MAISAKKFYGEFGKHAPSGFSKCTDMHEVWQKAKPKDLVSLVSYPGVLTDKELRLFAVFCARQIEYLLTDPRLNNAIDTAERFANGKATLDDLVFACKAAYEAIGSDDGWVAYNTDFLSARGKGITDRDAGVIAWATAWREPESGLNSLLTSMHHVVNITAKNALLIAQADWLRANTKPEFERAVW